MTENRGIESSLLAENIRRIENMIKEGMSAGLEFMLKGELLNQRAQLSEIRIEEGTAESRKEEKVRESTALAGLIAAETRLNTEEKAQYGEFLEQEFFTRADFSKLDKFYSETWDKLSDEGKAQMSERVREGIRHNEYSFDELPENVRKKESEWTYLQITEQKPAAPGLENVPHQDKADFIRAYEAKDEKAVGEVLSRKGFSQNIYFEKSASLEEADATKEIDPSETKAVEPVKENSAVAENALASLSSVSPLDLSGSGGSRIR